MVDAVEWEHIENVRIVYKWTTVNKVGVVNGCEVGSSSKRCFVGLRNEDHNVSCECGSIVLAIFELYGVEIHLTTNLSAVDDDLRQAVGTTIGRDWEVVGCTISTFYVGLYVPWTSAILGGENLAVAIEALFVATYVTYPDVVASSAVKTGDGSLVVVHRENLIVGSVGTVRTIQHLVLAIGLAIPVDLHGVGGSKVQHYICRSWTWIVVDAYAVHSTRFRYVGVGRGALVKPEEDNFLHTIYVVEACLVVLPVGVNTDLCYFVDSVEVAPWCGDVSVGVVVVCLRSIYKQHNDTIVRSGERTTQTSLEGESVATVNRTQVDIAPSLCVYNCIEGIRQIALGSEWVSTYVHAVLALASHIVATYPAVGHIGHYVVVIPLAWILKVVVIRQ